MKISCKQVVRTAMGEFVVEIPTGTFKKGVEGKDRMNLIFLAIRPHIERLIGTIEQRHFQKSGDFIMFLLEWEETPWMVLNLPAGYLSTAHQVADETGFRLADGIPAMLSESGLAIFPVENNNSWHVEYK